jgi:hypothetical protein
MKTYALPAGIRPISTQEIDSELHLAHISCKTDLSNDPSASSSKNFFEVVTLGNLGNRYRTYSKYTTNADRRNEQTNKQHHVKTKGLQKQIEKFFNHHI